METETCRDEIIWGREGDEGEGAALFPPGSTWMKKHQIICKGLQEATLQS